jgi:hypothetical protein
VITNLSKNTYVTISLTSVSNSKPVRYYIWF